MKFKNLLFCLIIIFLFITFCQKQQPDIFNVAIQHLSDRVVVISGTQFATNQLAIKSQNGLILVDTGISPEYAIVVRDSLEQIFDQDKFVYVINTHHHWDHVQGNQAFPEATIVGHENCEAAMRLQKPANVLNKTLAKSINEGKKGVEKYLPPPPPSHILIDQKNGYQLTPPKLTFNDRLTIKAGDITMELFYYGKGHTDNDILIYVPEESLLVVGDLFYKKSLPPFSNRKNLQVSRWIDVLNRVLEENNSIKYVVPGHYEIFGREELESFRNYIETLWRDIGNEISKDKSLSEIQKHFSLQNMFPKLVNKDMSGEKGGSLHQGNVEKFWRQYKTTNKKMK